MHEETRSQNYLSLSLTTELEIILIVKILLYNVNNSRLCYSWIWATSDR